MTGTTQIEAGRELDALVGVEVMGWKQVNTRWWVRLDGVSVPHPPTYSTTGDGMLAVLERMRALGWYVRIGDGSDDGPNEPGEPNQDPFLVVFMLNRGFDDVGDEDWAERQADADTLPHAVCLAALEAVRA